MRGPHLPKAIAVACVTSVFSHVAAGAPDGPERPNILWITCEDISADLGCYGDSYARTPNLDRLATEAVLYTNMYATAPVCSPARSCIITGVHACSLGTQHLRSNIAKPVTFRCFTEYLREAGYYCTNNSKEDYQFRTPKAAWDESSRKAHWRKRPAGKPFFSVINLTMTHQSQTRYTVKKLQTVNARLPEALRHDPAEAPLPPYYPDTKVIRENVAAYHTQITLMDRAVGRILGELHRDGLSENTIVFFFSDHGGGIPRGKRWLHHNGIRVPFMVRCPGKYRQLVPGEPGTRSDRLVSFVDLAPTMLSLTGLPLPGHLQGRAFLGGKA
ncbi:MAG: sulfatase family protein, partial [Planctomycetota bacterium]